METLSHYVGRDIKIYDPKLGSGYDGTTVRAHLESCTEDAATVVINGNAHTLTPINFTHGVLCYPVRER